jgi:hypothetical protein
MGAISMVCARLKGAIITLVTVAMVGMSVSPVQAGPGLFGRLFGGRAAYRPVYVYPTTTFYAPTTTTAFYAPATTAAYYAPTTQTCNYVPETTYRDEYVTVPVTTMRPGVGTDACTGCPVTTYYPTTTYTQQVRRVPVTTYRQVCTPAPTVACYAPTVACCPTTCAPCAPVAGTAAAPESAGGSQETFKGSPETPEKGGAAEQSSNSIDTASDRNEYPSLFDPQNKIAWRASGERESIRLVSRRETKAPVNEAPSQPTAAKSPWRSSSR